MSISHRQPTAAIAVVAPQHGVQAETFIRAHVERLPASVVALTTADIRRGDFAAARTLRERNVKAVVAEYGPTAVACLQAAAIAGMPLVAYFHGYDAYRHDTLRRYRSAYARLWRDAEAIVAVSHAMEQQLMGLGAPRARLHYNPCGADTMLFHGADPAAAPPTLLSVGRFVDKKAPHLTLLAFGQVVEALPAARLHMIGDGPLRAECQRLVERLGLGRHVVFWGTRSHALVADAMRGARALVQHSLWAPCGDGEGTPVAILEAGAAGLPVIATRHAGIPEVVRDGETGLLVDSGDVPGMAGAMLDLCADAQRAARLGASAQCHIQALHSMEGHIATLWKIIETAIAQHRLASRGRSYPA